VQRRLDDYQALMTRADRLYDEVPSPEKDALFELIVYPVRAAALANRRYFSFEKSTEYLAQGRASAIEWARRAQDADARMTAETDYYNEKLAHGKWRRMMTIEPPNGQWQNMRMTTPRASTALAQMDVPASAGLGVAIEGRSEPVKPNEPDAALPVLNVFTRDTSFVDIFNIGRSPARWTAKASHPWIKLSRVAGDLKDDTRVDVSIDWARAPQGENISGAIEIDGAGASRTVRVPIFNPTKPRREELKGFVESDGVVSIEAEHFTGKIDRAGASWQVIPGLGRTGDSVAVFPTTVARFDPVDAPVLEYEFYAFTTGKVNAVVNIVPTHPILAGRGLRYAIGFDEEPPQVVTVGADLQIPSRPWSLHVVNSSTVGASTHEIKTAGRHVLKIYAVDPGVVLDKIVLDLGGLRPSYLGPMETRASGFVK
jgi:hypothetical protein